MLEYKRYTLDGYLHPIWCGDTVINETIMFLGAEDCARLIYDDVEIISVRSYDLATEYLLHKDYEVENNCIKRTSLSRIPFWELDRYYPAVLDTNCGFECVAAGKPFIVFGEGDTFCKTQLAVSYRHKDCWRGALPIDESKKFSRTVSLLEQKKNASVVFFGDSIMTGANSSSFVGCEPYADGWPNMVTKFLKEKFSTDFIMTNSAVGGKRAQWGLENVENSVNAFNPDLLVLGFGMNDADIEPLKYREQILAIINCARLKNPLCEIMLVSPMLPNAEVKGFFGNQIYFEAELLAIAKNCERIGVANVTSMHKELLRHKRYFDMTGNNVNHPNDFLSRLYAQVILQTLLGKI